MSSSPRCDPRRSLCVQDLARARLDRHTLLGKQDDLERSILYFTEAIYLPLPWGPSPLIVLQIFYSLAFAVFLRAKEYGQARDVRCCTMYLRYIREQWPEDRFDLPIPVTETLVSALAVQVELKPRDVDQVVEEMADLCGELLDSHISRMSRTGPITAFAGAIGGHFEELFGGQIPSEKVIRCLRKATMRFPDLHEVAVALAKSLLIRFNRTPSDDDYKEGIAMLDKVITFRGPGDRESQYREMALDFAALFAKVHFDAYGKPEHLEDAIYRLRAALDGMSLDNPDRPLITANLAYLQGFRFDGSSPTTNVQYALSIPFESAKLPSFQDLISSLHELNDISLPEETRFGKHFDALERTSHLTDMAEIEDGVKYCRQLLVSYPSSQLSPSALSSLTTLLGRAFECTNEIGYLDEAISADRSYMNIAPSQRSRDVSLVSLTSRLLTRLVLLRRKEDLDELMQTFAKAAKLEHSGSFRRFPLSYRWASIARSFKHPSTPLAYDSAMTSIQATLTFSPTLDTQHSRLSAMIGDLTALPLDYTSYLIHTNRIKQAIEVLERGRALLWSEIRGLRTSIDQIRMADAHLAEEFAAVNRDLETLTLAFSSNVSVDGGDGDVEGMGPFGRLVVQQQELLDDREKLISQIQTLPGFKTFLKPPSFATLRSATSRGPIIIINHCKWRSDMIVLLYNLPPSIISTSDDFYGRAHNLQKQLLGERTKGLESGKYEEALRAVLKELYELVGRPVIKRLNELNIPEQSRVWWCPTSVFCSLPLHAMGPIPSDVGPPRYFLDLYIPSYIPSLSALIDSRKSSLQTLNKPSILLVAQPDEKMPQALKEMKEVQAVDTQVTTLFSAKATPTAVLKRLRDHPFAHIVCHGILEPGKPFEASFKLHRGKRLQLLDVVRSQLPDAEFAFLSACHTAELTDESIADEVLHLAAAMQFCGFRSVVGTMWAMADVDGRDLARSFYESVFSDETHVVRYYERTAEALRDAVVKLRRKRGMTLERWVNYVHHGA